MYLEIGKNQKLILLIFLQLLKTLFLELHQIHEDKILHNYNIVLKKM